MATADHTVEGGQQIKFGLLDNTVVVVVVVVVVVNPQHACMRGL